MTPKRVRTPRLINIFIYVCLYVFCFVLSQRSTDNQKYELLYTAPDCLTVSSFFSLFKLCKSQRWWFSLSQYSRNNDGVVSSTFMLRNNMGFVFFLKKKKQNTRYYPKDKLCSFLIPKLLDTYRVFAVF